ncbi:MAG: response regulator [Steroidobacteraceae bacterium]|jgi:putative nucleotidyltransferase with HDIG domain
MMRILFVDDEIEVMQAMRRSVREMRNEWNMEFALSGVAALEELARTPTDVIVSDMRMPGMDGWELLAEVKKLYPQTVRLVLSGSADAGSIMRAVGTAHQYLAKPCESAALKEAISKTYRLRQLLSSDRLAHLVGCVDMLPSAPKAFLDISACLRRPTATIADAAKIIGRDVAMTANVIKLVNSAFFGTRQPIGTADRAVAYLGLDTIGALVLGHGVFKSGVTTDMEGFSLEELWQHSLDVAAAARTVALYEKLPRAHAEQAFLAGMLHDVGKVVYATRRARATDSPNLSGEEAFAQMEAHHAEVGAYLLGLWGFPTSIVEAVAFHHSPTQTAADGLSLTRLVHIADRLVHQRQGQSPDSSHPELEAELLEKLALVDHWPAWLAELDSLASGRTAA